MKDKGDVSLILGGALTGAFVTVWSPGLGISVMKWAALFIGMVALLAFLSASRVAPVIKGLPENDRNVLGLLRASRDSHQARFLLLRFVALMLAVTIFAAGIASASAIIYWLLIKGA